jgi:hypothetical protein
MNMKGNTKLKYFTNRPEPSLYKSVIDGLKMSRTEAEIAKPIKNRRSTKPPKP